MAEDQLFDTKPRSRTGIVVVIVLVLVVLAALVWVYRDSPTLSHFLGTNTATTTPQGGDTLATVNYSCDGGKSINATFYQGAASTTAPGGSVTVVLSDGRTMTLQQTISADGARYSNGNPQVAQGQPGAETFVFWSKGNGAMVLENNQQQTYTGCVVVAANPSNLSQIYTDTAGTMSIRYPVGYTPDPTYQYTDLGPGDTINGVKFTIPESLHTNTNLGPDSYISVEQIPNAQSCTAGLFLQDGSPAPQIVTDNNTQYSSASTTGAGAGNRYEEWVYALPGTNPCTAVRYFIHYSVIDNYPPGTVNQFDHAALIAQFDAIRRTLTLNQ